MCLGSVVSEGGTGSEEVREIGWAREFGFYRPCPGSTGRLYRGPQGLTSPPERAELGHIVTSLHILRPFSYLSQLFSPGLGSGICQK